MSELNFELLQQNIRILIQKNGITQLQLAEIAGMSQANVSKALNPKETKQFTIDQVFRIAQHFGVSIDELTGNRAAQDSSTSPQAMLALIANLLGKGKIRATTVPVKEHTYEFEYGGASGAEMRTGEREIEYPAFYFPDYFSVWDFTGNDIDAEEAHYAFLAGGNETGYQSLNFVLKKFIPVIKLYREKDIAEEAFKMVLEGYMNQV